MNARLVSLPDSLVNELREVVPVPTVQLVRYESSCNDPLGLKVDDLLNTNFALNKQSIIAYRSLMIKLA